MGEKKSPAGRGEIAYFAAGCFWSKEYFFRRREGVLFARVGFMGGHKEHPTYREVCAKNTGHAETVEVTFDPSRTSFEQLARYFFEIHDPTIDRRDKGGQYRSAIFFANETQRIIARRLIDQLAEKGLEAVTELTPAGIFWPAEGRHQQYCDARGLTPKSDHHADRFAMAP